MHILDIINILFHSTFGTLDAVLSAFTSLLPSIKMLSVEYWICFGLGIPVIVLYIIRYCMRKLSKKDAPQKR